MVIFGFHFWIFFSQDSGADSRQVQSELHHVQQIAANKGAFAALRTDGTVVTWGDPEYGGDSSEVQDQLRPGLWLVRGECGKSKTINHLNIAING